VSGGVLAQTDTPTPSPTPSATPAITNTPNADFLNTDLIPSGDINDLLSTAVAYVNSLPDDITAPSGISLIPDETATQLFGWAKWLFSADSANESLGLTLAPLALTLMVLLTLVVSMAIAYTTLKIAVFIYRLVTYVIQWILKFVPFIG
jgi:hypothetical protein